MSATTTLSLFTSATSKLPATAEPAENAVAVQEIQAREYQRELLERVLKHNLIIALGTGTGKTFIAVMLLNEFADKLQIDDKRAVFAVPSIPLVFQQAKYIRRHTNFRVGQYCGETGVDLWKPDRWRDEISNHEVLVMVYETFRCALELAYLKAESVAVVIVDECHHTRKESPIRIAMHELKRQVMLNGKKCVPPRVLGLTASVINITINESQLNDTASIFDLDEGNAVKRLMDPLEESIAELELVMLDAVVAQPRDLSAADECGALPEILTRRYEVHLVHNDFLNVLGRVGTNMLENGAPMPTAEQQRILKTFDHMLLYVERFLTMRDAGKAGKELSKVLKRKLNQVRETYKELGVMALHNAIFMLTEWLSFTNLTGVPPEIISPVTHSLLCDFLTLQRSLKLHYDLPASSKNLAAGQLPIIMSSAVIETMNLLSENFDRLRNEHGKPLCAIVFVQRRVTAWTLHSLIQSASRVPDSRYGKLRSSFIVGQGGLSESSSANDFLEHDDDFAEVEADDGLFKGHIVGAHRARGGQKELERFRRGQINVLVATSVVEEGLDVPQCNLIVRFNIPGNYRGFVQSKGRARAKNALYFVMVPRVIDSFAQKKLNLFRRTYDEIVRRCVDRFKKQILPPGITHIMPSFNADLHDKVLFPMKPFRNAVTGAAINMGNAIAVLYQYCASLKSEAGVMLYPFTTFSNEGEIGDAEFDERFGEWGRAQHSDDDAGGDQPPRNHTLYCCTIVMPLNSPLRESITGDGMPNKASAKQSACQRACVKLYTEHDELDHHYKPKNRDTWEPELLNDLGMEAAEVKQLNALSHVERKETEREDMQFEKRIPRVFMPLSSPSNVLYLYALEISLSKELLDDVAVRKSLPFRPETSKCLFGLVSHVPLPTLADFTVFDRDGEMSVTVTYVTQFSRTKLLAESMQLINTFHKYLIDIPCRYDLIEKSVEFNANFSAVVKKQYFIVPLLRDAGGRKAIDFDTMHHVRQHLNGKSCKCYNGVEKNWSDYADAVVRPTYRVQIDRKMSHYIVTAVRSDKTPLSKFDSEKYPDFVKYFEQQYQVKVKNLSQPLLQCVPSPSRLNRLNFERDAKKVLDAIHLIPELVEREPILGSLWRQAIMLPSILHRLETFLIADEVRREWQQRTYIGQAENVSMSMNEEQKWTALQPNLSPECATTNLKPLEPTNVVVNDDEIEIIREFRPRRNLTAETRSNNILMPFSPPSERKLAVSLRKMGQLQIDHIDRIDADDPDQIYVNISIGDEKRGRFMANNSIRSGNKRDSNGNAVEVPHSISLPTNMSNFAVSPSPPKSSKPILTFQPNLAAIEKLCRSMQFDDENESMLRNTATLNQIQGPEPTLILQALTTAKCGEQFQLERLEMLGDCALKLFTTWFLYCRYPHFREDKMTYAKKILISNAFLCVLAKKNELCGAMFVQRFDPPNNWLPPCYAPVKKHALSDLLVKKSSDAAAELPSFDVEQLNSQKMRLKSIADCVEALIGAYLLSSGLFAAQIFMHAFGMHVFPHAFGDGDEKRRWPVEKIIAESRTCGYKQLFRPPTTALIKVTDLNDAQRQIMLRKLLSGSDKLEATIGYTFKDKSFLLQALTHPAYANNRVTGCYQRLEFLGDALIDYVITQYIFRKRLDATPGALTDMRTALTNNTLFATVAVRNRLHTHLKHCDGKLYAKIRNFISWICGNDADDFDAFRLTLVEQYYNKHENVDVAASTVSAEGSESKPNRIVLPNNVKIIDEFEDVEAPKALGDLIESLAGAIYLDSGQSLQAVWKFVCRMMHEEIEAFTSNAPPKNHKRELYELMPNRVKDIGWEQKADGRIQHVLMLLDQQIAFRGVGANKHVAANAAAKCALAYLTKQRASM